jgi:hypothetical protein
MSGALQIVLWSEPELVMRLILIDLRHLPGLTMRAAVPVRGTQHLARQGGCRTRGW